MKQSRSGFSAWWLPAGAFFLLLLAWIVSVRQSLLMVLTPFLISAILAYLLAPLVRFMERRRISRTIAIIVIYLVVFMIIFIFCVRVMPMLMDDLQKLVIELPDYAASLQDFLHHLESDYHRFNLPPNVREIIDNNIQGLGRTLTFQLERSHDFLLDLFGRVVLLLLVPVLTFYFLRDEEQLKKRLLDLFPRRYKRELTAMAEEVDCALGALIRGALLVSLLVGILTYVGLLLLQVNFPLVLASIVGITNLIPYIGPVIGALPALLVAFLQTPFLSLKVLLLIFVIQQVESQLVLPLIIGRSTRLHPLVIILVLLVGGSLFGFTGLILAVPAVIITRIIASHIYTLLKPRLS